MGRIVERYRGPIVRDNDVPRTEKGLHRRPVGPLRERSILLSSHGTGCVGRRRLHCSRRRSCCTVGRIDRYCLSLLLLALSSSGSVEHWRRLSGSYLLCTSSTQPERCVNTVNLRDWVAPL